LNTTNPHRQFLWEVPHYPAYYIPIADIDAGVLVDENRVHRLRRGPARRHGLRVGTISRPGSVRVYDDDAMDGLSGMARLDWDAVDAWYEEDEEVFVHPRNPYVRVDAVRSTRHVRVELDGVVLAESSSPVLVFETGLPTRYCINRTEVDFDYLVPTSTETACPYKGTTSGYRSAHIGDQIHHDLAWTYDFPTRQLLPIAGQIAFYNERVDLIVDGESTARRHTFSASASGFVSHGQAQA
jgi:uncharacterized protein (DUF427 family)